MTTIDRFLAAVTSASIPSADDVWSADAVLDATVPNWRMTINGAEAIRAELTKWYAGKGEYEQLDQVPIPGGSVVRFLLTWTEHGIPHVVHQAHFLQIRDDRIVAHQVWCGGRWAADLLAEMEKAGA
jgi:SnoaL-like domain